MNDFETVDPGDPVVLDEDHLRLVCDQDPDFEKEIVGDFLAQVGPQVAALVAAVSSEDASAVAFAAHSLKGSCRSLGAVALAEACSRLELMARGGDLRAAPHALGHAHAELGRLREAIRIRYGGLAA